MNRLIVIPLIILLSGCSNYQLTSNVDQDNFNTYFKPSEVTIYTKSELSNLEYTVLGAVEGSSCQEEAKDLPADIKQARTKARINASEMHANGVIFQSCLNFQKDESCVTNVICYGRALEVELPHND